MGRKFSDEDDWRGWKNGKYDNRYSNNWRRSGGKNPYKKKQGKKISVGVSIFLGIVLVGFLFVNGIFEFNQEKLDESIQNLPQNIEEVAQTAENMADKTTSAIQETVNEQILLSEENEQIRNSFENTGSAKLSPEVKISEKQSSKEYSLQELKQIALNDINRYRNEYGLSSIPMGYAKSPQLYASELLVEGCIHHISDRGEGPMLRYKNNNDQMFLIWENIGGGLGTSWETPEESILNSNHSMMYDDAHANWGHRDNILEPAHQSVSIGIAYDSARLVMVQDFEQTLMPGYEYDPSSFQKEPVDERYCW
jgi:hypothetical protein